MKKIVGILAAAAVLATSVFAADVSAKVKLTGSLLDVGIPTTSGSATFSAFGLNPHRSHDWEPDLALSYSEDKAGAEIAFKTLNEWGSGEGETSTNWKIWFKPIDVLKFNIGRIGDSLNTESIDYSNRIYNYDEWGYRLEFASNGFTLAAALHFGQGKNFLSQYKNANGADSISIHSLAVYAQYGADFGTIKALIDVKTASGEWAQATEDSYAIDPKTGTIKKTAAKAAAYTATSGSLFAGAGYSNSFGAISLFVDAGIKLGLPEAGEGSFDVLADLDFKYAQDAIYAELYSRLTFAAKKEGNAPIYNPIDVMLIAKASYQLDPCKLYVYFKSADLLAKKDKKAQVSDSVFSSTIKLGAEGSCGACGWNIWAQLDTFPYDDATKAYKDQIQISVPVEFTVAW